MKKEKIKMYEVVFYDEWIDDYGVIHKGAKKEIIKQSILEWYKKNVDLWIVKEL